MSDTTDPPSDATLEVDDADRLTVRLGSDGRAIATGVTNTAAIAILVQHCAELGRSITVTTHYPGGHTNRQVLQPDGTMIDSSRMGVDRVLAGHETRPSPVGATVPGADDEPAPAASSTDPVAQPPAPSRRPYRRSVAVAIAVAATAALIAVLAVNASGDGARGPLPRFDRPGEAVEFARAGSTLVVPLGLVTKPTPPPPTLTPTPTPTTTTGSPGTGSPTPVPPTDPLGPVDRAAPTIPHGLTLTARTGTTLRLTWDQSTDNVAVTGYVVYLNDRRVDTIVTPVTEIAGLVTATTYAIGVEAIDAAGNVSTRAVLQADTADTIAPTAPTGVGVGARTGTSLTLVWRSARDNVGVKTYLVYLDGGEVTSVAANTATVSGLVPVTTYTLGVAAVDADGNVSPRTSVTGTTADSIAPERVPSLSTEVTTNSIAMQWKPASDNVGVTAYAVLLNGRRVSTPSNLQYTITGLSPGTKYTVSVAALDAAGNAGPVIADTVGTHGVP